MSEKVKFVQLCCDFYNQHSESDKQWFARNYDQCDEPHQKDNMCMYQWQFPLFVLRSQQAEIEQPKKEHAELLAFNEVLDRKHKEAEAQAEKYKFKVDMIAHLLRDCSNQELTLKAIRTVIERVKE